LPEKQIQQAPKETEEIEEIEEELNPDILSLKLTIAQDKLLAQKKRLPLFLPKIRNEAKQFIQQQSKEKAIFILKRLRLYKKVEKQLDNQYAIIQKLQGDIGSKTEMTKITKVLKETNDLIHNMGFVIKYEQMHKLDHELKEREKEKTEFKRLFEEHFIHDDEMNELFEQYVAKLNKETEKLGRQDEGSNLEQSESSKTDLTGDLKDEGNLERDENLDLLF